jgi:ERCC4-type nuclease
MFIKIDCRESDFMTNMNLLFKEHSHEIQLESLPLGDIILLNKENSEKVIFERKSLYDLASSIKDGRYSEQSFRLNQCKIHNHNIIYIIEGDFEKYNPKKGRMDKKTLYSALITLNYFKGYSVIRTKNINETCELVVNFADKLEKESKKESYYEADKMKTTISVNTMNETTETTETIETTEIPETAGPRYCEVMKKQKKDNITTENIGEIMLSCIPGVSSKSAITIMKEYKTVKNLINNLQENEGCLDGMKMITENGMSRKISKSCIENIKKFVLV